MVRYNPLVRMIGGKQFKRFYTAISSQSRAKKEAKDARQSGYDTKLFTWLDAGSGKWALYTRKRTDKKSGRKK